MKGISMAASAAALGTLFAGALALMSIADFIELMSGITIFACVTLIVLYVPLWFPAVRGRLEPEYRLGLGGLFLVLSILGNRIWSSLSRIAGFPEWMQYHWTLALWPFLAVVGCGILITVPSNLDGTVQRRSWVLLLFSIATGALVAGIVIGIRWKEEIIQTLPG